MDRLVGKAHWPPIPDLHHPTASTILTTPAEKAAALNQFFALQTDLPGRDSCPDSSQLSVNTEEFSTLQSTPAEVKRILSSLPIRKASGNDGISTRLLRECANSISVSLSALFDRSFNECHFPSAWKDALVVPVFKRGDRSNLSNYRPISLLPVVSKVCERVVYNKLSHFLSSFLSERQSGFRKGDSTSFQLTRLVQTWSEAIDRSECVGAVFFYLRRRLTVCGMMAFLLSYMLQVFVAMPSSGFRATFLIAASRRRWMVLCRVSPLFMQECCRVQYLAPFCSLST